MRVYFLIIIALLISSSLPAQTFKFQVNQKANVTIGKEWDFKYKQLKTPIDVILKDKVLSMTYTTGKVYWNTNVLEINEIKDGLTLKCKDNKGYVFYILYEKINDQGSISEEIKIPFILDGKIISYEYFLNYKL